MNGPGTDPHEAGDGQQPGAHDTIGSAAEEALKLFGALADWGREHGPGLAGQAVGAAAAAHDLTRDVGEHLDTGAPECSYCPICRTAHAIREASPEIRTHLTTAAASLMQAAASIMQAAAAPPTGTGPRSRSHSGPWGAGEPGQAAGTGERRPDNPGDLHHIALDDDEATSWPDWPEPNGSEEEQG